MTLFERLGRHSAAARCALAAARQVCLLRWLFTSSSKLTCAGLGAAAFRDRAAFCGLAGQGGNKPDILSQFRLLCGCNAHAASSFAPACHGRAP